MCFLPFCGAASRVSRVCGSENRGAGRPRLSLVLPIHALAVRRAEFPPAVVFVGDEDDAAAAGAGEDPEDGSLSHLVRRAARLFPVGPAAARFGAEALRSLVRGEGPAAAGAYGLYVHRMPRSAGKKTRKKGRVKSSLRIVNPGSVEVPRYAVTVKDAAAGAKLLLIPPRLRVMRGICFAARPASLRTELMTFTSFCSNGFIISTPCRCVNGYKNNLILYGMERCHFLLQSANHRRCFAQ